MKPKLHFLILTCNHLGMTLQCFKTWNQIWNYPNHLYDVRVTVLDNASQDNTGQWLLKWSENCPQAQVILSSENLKVAGGRQKLLDIALSSIPNTPDDLIIFMDNDTLYTGEANLFKDLLAAFSQPDVGGVGKDGYVYSATDKRFVLPDDTSPVTDVDYFSGFFQVFRRAAIERAKVYFHIEYNDGGFEDTAFCYDLRAAGWRLTRCRLLPVFHNARGTWWSGHIKHNHVAMIFAERYLGDAHGLVGHNKVQS